MDTYLIYKSGRREKSLKVVLGIIGIFTVVVNFILHRYLKLVVGLTLILLSFYRKEIYINNKTIEFVHRGLFLKHIDTLQISDITDIVIKEKEEEMILCLINNYNLKKIIVDKNCSSKILEHLLEKNKRLQLS